MALARKRRGKVLSMKKDNTLFTFLKGGGFRGLSASYLNLIFSSRKDAKAQRFSKNPDKKPRQGEQDLQDEDRLAEATVRLG